MKVTGETFSLLKKKRNRRGTLPSAPILSDPGTTLPSPATYTVSWSAVTGASSYVLQEATSSNFTSGLQEYPLTDTSKSFSHTVTTSTTYYYQVAAINSYGQSDWSSVEDITVVIVTGPVHNLTKNIYYNTIQAALDDADSLGGDIIEVADGTYDESINFPSGKVIILQSVNGASSTTITGVDGSATVTFDGSLTGTTIKGFTITHVEGLTGSRVYIVSSDLTINDCTISGNNVSQQGGGIYLEGTGTIAIGGSSSIDTDNFNTFTDNKKDGIISADQHIRDSSGDCRSSYPNNDYDPN